MPDFVALWVYLASKPLFGLTATLSVYVLAMSAYRRVGQAPWANPVLWSMLVLATALVLTGVDYGTYFAGAQFIHFLLGPAVVALGWPLYERLGELRQHWHRILLAALALTPTLSQAERGQGRSEQTADGHPIAGAARILRDPRGIHRVGRHGGDGVDGRQLVGMARADGGLHLCVMAGQGLEQHAKLAILEHLAAPAVDAVDRLDLRAGRQLQVHDGARQSLRLFARADGGDHQPG